MRPYYDADGITMSTKTEPRPRAPTPARRRDLRAIQRAKMLTRDAMGTPFAVRRAHEIARSPSKRWKGRILYKIRCAGPFGNGPHNQYIPGSVLWSLIDLDTFCCPYHR